MDKRDLRIYYYAGGQLLKVNNGNKLHRAKTEEQVRDNIYKWIRVDKRHRNNQYVIIEYFKDCNDSRIVDIIEPVPE